MAAPDDGDGTGVQPTRRTVTRAAAWSVPVVVAATTAPAFAASCPRARATVSDLTTFARTSATRWTATFDVDGTGPRSAIDVTIEATYDPGMRVRNDANGGPRDNFTITGPVGGLGTYGLVLAQRPTEDTPRSRLHAAGHYRFTFARPVSNLTFTVTNIDSATGDCLDSVALTPGFTFAPLPTTLQGVGTSGNPFRPRSPSAPIDGTNSTAGNVRITYAGPLTTFTIDYKNAATSFAWGVDQDQVVTVTDAGFEFQPC